VIAVDPFGIVGPAVISFSGGRTMKGVALLAALLGTPASAQQPSNTGSHIVCDVPLGTADHITLPCVDGVCRCPRTTDQWRSAGDLLWAEAAGYSERKAEESDEMRTEIQRWKDKKP
jgi:hypothetical protein